MGAWILISFVAMTTVIASGAAAEDAGDAGLKACRAEADDARRLACYDREMDRVQEAAPAAAAPPAAAQPTAEARFGRERAIVREETERQERETSAIGELQAQVVEIQTRSDGLMTFTLDNGQVWRQNAPDSKFRLKKGEMVRIQPGAMNSFILSGPSKRSTRVSRLK